MGKMQFGEGEVVRLLREKELTWGTIRSYMNSLFHFINFLTILNTRKDALTGVWWATCAEGLMIAHKNTQTFVSRRASEEQSLRQEDRDNVLDAELIRAYHASKSVAQVFEKLLAIKKAGEVNDDLNMPAYYKELVGHLLLVSLVLCLKLYL